MCYTHLIKEDLVLIEEYHECDISNRKNSERLKHGHETIYRIIRRLNKGLSAIEVYFEYQKQS